VIELKDVAYVRSGAADLARAAHGAIGHGVHLGALAERSVGGAVQHLNPRRGRHSGVSADVAAAGAAAARLQQGDDREPRAHGRGTESREALERDSRTHSEIHPS